MTTTTGISIALQCITPDRAQQQIHDWHNKFYQTLLEGGYRGSYSLHSAFADGTFGLQEPKEAIVVLLETDISDTLAISLEEVFSPIVAAVGTAESLLESPGDEVRGDPGVEGREPLETTTKSSDGVGEDQVGKGEPKGKGGVGAGDGSSSRGGGGGRGGSEGGDGDGEGGRGRGNGDRGCGNGDGDLSRTSGVNGYIKFPFSALLKDKDGEIFIIGGNIVAAFSEEDTSGLWPSPSLAVGMDMLQALTNSADYRVNDMQARVMASATSTTVVNRRPIFVHAQAEPSMRHTTNALKSMYMNASPTNPFGVGGRKEMGSIHGFKRVQNPWVIRSNSVAAEQDDCMADGSTCVIWHYHRNLEGGFPSLTEARFSPPAGLFGLERDHPRLPWLEARITTFWSYTPRRKPGVEKAHTRLTKPLPAQLNFLHCVSITFDLQQFNHSGSGTFADQIPDRFAAWGSLSFSPHQLPSKLISDTLEIHTKQAVEGQVKDFTAEFKDLGLGAHIPPAYPPAATSTGLTAVSGSPGPPSLHGLAA
ncbi:hypothetical protein DXG01_002898 [Tephrocybe rancida]|nr:hypothetical protein DXG01_002898 [Tephrocybe rancida]